MKDSEVQEDRAFSGPTFPGTSILWGLAFIIFGFLSFSGVLFAGILSKLLQPYENQFLHAIQNDSASIFDHRRSISGLEDGSKCQGYLSCQHPIQNSLPSFGGIRFRVVEILFLLEPILLFYTRCIAPITQTQHSDVLS